MGALNHADVFAALGDPVRLSVINRLSRSEPLSITRLTEGTDRTRQAMTKHLRVLENAGLVRSIREGRESRFALQTETIADARQYLDEVSRQWEEALMRLQAFVEDGREM
ncbi:ArsR/SmtB family transcription factor [Methylovirgula sp. 4M-Z18]|uniref:ArsR/SmtB family transcription factor n=1 Tax=Methylovirgula sp. 4M-Z18 TaxID=2293567 RepID=UPI000E2E7317|nr:metalloregulator ArsR/SmtB family transcription factor [Methylovirgula sp. 4M-Z18]RFB80676.1 ArsR family transcriptional regulator [Methylovirgula sp. 4M-Z18]